METGQQAYRRVRQIQARKQLPSWFSWIETAVTEAVDRGEVEVRECRIPFEDHDVLTCIREKGDEAISIRAYLTSIYYTAFYYWDRTAVVPTLCFYVSWRPV